MRRIGVSYAQLNMKTMLTKTLKHAPVNGCTAIWQRDSRRFGIVGMKF